MIRKARTLHSSGDVKIVRRFAIIPTRIDTNRVWLQFFYKRKYYVDSWGWTSTGKALTKEELE